MSMKPDEHVGSGPKATLEQMQTWAQVLMHSRKPDFIIGDNYLHRWWVIPRNDYSNIYLHDILHSDDDRAFHDHPWDNTSFLIYGSYIEHTPEGVFTRRAGDVISRPATALHRLEVIPGQRAISLFSTGPTIREWGFACDHGWVHWMDFTKPGAPGQTGPGAGEPGNLTPTSPVGGKRPGL